MAITLDVKVILKFVRSAHAALADAFLPCDPQDWERKHDVVAGVVSHPVARRVEELRVAAIKSADGPSSDKEVSEMEGEFHLSLSGSTQPSETLRVLDLTGCGSFSLSAGMVFPRLTTLRLRLRLCVVQVKDLQGVVDSAPALTTVHLDGRNEMGIVSVLMGLGNEWAVQALVLFSFTLQVTLLSLAWIRRHSIATMPKLVLWVAYQLADSTALFTLGHMAISSRSREEQPLMAFWAPFLILHLGGQDNITAYSFEDNRLWLRHLQTLVVQVMGASYVLYKYMPGKETLVMAAAVLIFVVGILKYGERIWALREATFDNIARCLDQQEDYASAREREGDDLLQHVLQGRSSMDEENVLIGAHGLLDICRGLFIGSRGGRRGYLRHVLLSFQMYGRLDKLMELELSLMYDILYTKATVIHTWIGCCIRVIALAATVTATFLFLLSSKHGHSRKDLAVTYVLLAGALLLEMISMVRAVFSTWTVVFLYKLKWYWLYGEVLSIRRVFRVATHRRHVLLSFQMYGRLDKLMELELSLMYDILYTKATVIHTWIGCCIRVIALAATVTATFLFLLSSKHGHSRKDLAVTYVLLAGALLLEMISMVRAVFSTWTVVFLYKLKWYWLYGEVLSIRRVFRVATHRRWSGTVGQHNFLWASANAVDASAAAEAKEEPPASEPTGYYCLDTMDRCCCHRTKLSDSTKEQIMRKILEMHENRQEIGSQPGDLFVWALRRGLHDHLNSDDPPAQYDTGVRLAAVLYHRLDRLDIIFGVWVEMLSYVACNCSRESHARQLSSGGELVTIVWLMARLVDMS
ncbi:hypothetical protein OsJ_13900 [Oryza sativa Japonica Group]|uniref:DUF4220 domain-containing protein n=1 Tax=Oryza sativa subsp. japonica TaxID=39947 RepID=B9FDW7_ORYSJ|nr:hypothetical protein OsJ_13900 [Oryza sativa Japonica Group]